MPLFRGMKRWGVLLSVLLLSSLLLAACGENSPSILNPAGPVALKESNLFWFILVVATIVFVVVEGLLIYSIVRFRERQNMHVPRQGNGSNIYVKSRMSDVATGEELRGLVANSQ